jgi:hypothetical protein
VSLAFWGVRPCGLTVTDLSKGPSACIFRVNFLDCLFLGITRRYFETSVTNYETARCSVQKDLPLWLILSYLTFLGRSMWRVFFCGVTLFWLVGFCPVDGDSVSAKHLYICQTTTSSAFETDAANRLEALINSIRTPWMHWGVEVQLHLLLISKLDKNSWSASNLYRFTPLHLLTRRVGGPQSRSGWF